MIYALCSTEQHSSEKRGYKLIVWSLVNRTRADTEMV